MSAHQDTDALSKLRDDANFAYFENLAPHYDNYQRRRWYYWNDIARYVDYFSHPDYRVLEIGCATGNLLSKVKGQRKVGIDFSPAMIDEARRLHPECDFRVMQAENLQLDEQFDLIFISNVIGYMSDVEAVFMELRKVCHPRTKIIVTYHNYIWQPILRLGENLGLKKKTPAQNWLSLRDINNLLYLAGFDVYRVSRRLLLPVNVPLLSPLLNRYIAKLPIVRHLCLNMFSFAVPQNRIPEETYSQQYTTSIVIPARNESGNIENALRRLPRFGKELEVIFIEGNSTDDTWETIQEVAERYKDRFNIKIGQQDGKGKGDAVRKGFGMATGDILMILDADLTVPPEDLPKFYDAIASGKGDFINGSRLVYKMEKKAMRFLNLLGNKFFSILFSWLLEQPFKDTLCGTKVIFREDYNRLISNRKFFGDFDPFGDFDLIFGAYKLNLKIAELPIRYRERTYGSTNISRFRHGFILLRMCAFAARKIKFI